MKSRETLIRLKKFQVDEKRRRVTQIEGMITDFQRMSVDLEREIQPEQDRAGINDPSHSPIDLCKAAIQRRENMTRSADELRIQLEDAGPACRGVSRNSRNSNCLTSAIRRATRRRKRARTGRPRQYRPDARAHRAIA